MFYLQCARVAAAWNADVPRSSATGFLQSLPSTSFSFQPIFWPQYTGSESNHGTLQICRMQVDGPPPLGRRERDRQRLEKSLPNFEEITSEEVDNVLDLRRESMLYTETRNHYEIMFLVHEDYFEEVPDVIEKVKGFVGENRGIIWRLNDWGMRPLAYKIRKASNANYVLLNVEVGFDKINDLSKLLESDQRVIRYMLMRVKQAMKKDFEPPPILEERDSEDGTADEEEEDETESSVTDRTLV